MRKTLKNIARRENIALAGFTLLLAVIVRASGLPAPTLVAALIVGAVAAHGSGPRSIGGGPFGIAQMIVGVMIASSFTQETVSTLLRDWPLLLAVTAATVVFALLLGAVLIRSGLLPPGAGIWGVLPGGAAAMVSFAAESRDDFQLVAVMQYFRLLSVSALTLLIGSVIGDAPVSIAGGDADYAPFSAIAASGLALAGWGLFHALRMPGSALLGPILLCVCAALLGYRFPPYPALVNEIAFAVIGWKIGFGMDRKTIRFIAGKLPVILASTMLTMAGSAAIALYLHDLYGLGALEAYLATSPGGIDSVAIIASSYGGIDFALVMSFQIARLLAILAVSPLILVLMRRLRRGKA